MSDKIFLETPYVKVTEKSVIFNKSYKININDISSVIVTKQESKRRYLIAAGLFSLLIGIVFGAIGYNLATLFIMIGIISICMIFIEKRKYTLRVKIGLGEVRPIISYSENELLQIKDAMERAMNHDID